MKLSPINYGYFKTINLLYPLNFRIKNNVFFRNEFVAMGICISSIKIKKC